ncbi:arsenate reductase family protein [Bradyrhizobium arachidis]|uniref:arsenate reductase family protein n=1 Tax=Bradyrhizobium arachidis TaxID=858423 RepID=UPI002163524A|nr:arsenate reductase family protein [Bradyrhizobium arachidis]UVO30623.1 arsenate reductase family protein [Bradyrhizobium arachidis]
MATVLLWQKPGCSTNARQIRALEAAGHRVVAKNLLTELWTAPNLLTFFGDTPVRSWFNPAARQVKSGAIDPTAINAIDAIALLLESPLLIRRPLIEAVNMKCAGFDREPVLSLLGASPRRELQNCTHTYALPCTTVGPFLRRG